MSPSSYDSVFPRHPVLVYLLRMQETYYVIFTTYPTTEGAHAFATDIIDAGLAACVNILPAMRSIYFWQGQRQEGEETLLIIKTLSERYPEVEALIRSNHPYELPEIIALPISAGLPAYLAWITATVGRSA